MFARVQTFAASAESLDRLVELTRQQFDASRPEGLQRASFLVDRDGGTGLLISLWTSRDDIERLEAGNAASRQAVREHTGIEPPRSQVFEVAFETA